MTKREAIIVSAYTGVLLCDMSDLHAYIEEKLQRPVYTHELATEEMTAAIKYAATPDLIAIFEAAPASGLNALAAEVHQNAVDHGWWEEEREFGTIIALCHSELSEALEEYREDRNGICFSGHDPNGHIMYEDKPCPPIVCKPEGVAVELADCIIRILDYCGKAGIDIDEAIRIKHEYNKSRPYRHGGKRC